MAKNKEIARASIQHDHHEQLCVASNHQNTRPRLTRI
jgi:hypothetical protein